jgi:PAS domain S-box-containing protein
MLEEILENPAIDEYLCFFKAGDILFYEGDESQDLYILVSGHLEVLKGKKKISEVSERGSSFGEISFLLGTEKTVTVKAKSNGKAIRIPKDRVYQFWQMFPSLSWEIPRILAKKLYMTTQSFYVLKEFCDQLPDAVIAADSEGKILSWNTAAEDLFGMTWEQMQHGSIEEIFEDTKAYQDFLEEIQFKHVVTEITFKTKNPRKGTRYISASTTVLYDGHYRFKGFLCLSRDVTEIQNLKNMHRRGRFWLITSTVFLGLMVAFLAFAYPYFLPKSQLIGIKQQLLRDQLAKDSILLKSLLINSFIAKDSKKAAHLMQEFFKVHKKTVSHYKGILVLGKGKKVFAAFSPTMRDREEVLVGSNYKHISFQDIKKSAHKVLTLYRTGIKHPMGSKGVEIAFEMRKANESVGWLVFQMDMNLLKSQFDVSEETLRRFQF